MTDTEIFEDIRQIINKQFGVSKEKIEEESYFDSDLSISDIEMEDVISIVCEKYNLIIPEKVVPSIKKVSDLVNYIFENADITG